MTAPAPATTQSPLEAALHDVHATLTLLLAAADEQYAAVAADDRARIDSVTRQQERLSARLARAEAQRIHLTRDASNAADWSANLPREVAARVDELKTSIALAVRELKVRQAQTAGLLTDKIDLASNTLNFLRRLVTQPAPTYTGRGMNTNGHSVLVDSRA
jgi:flagellar biosynthesis/type III secretory pathway chaperone